MLIDTHAHLNFKAFKDDLEEVMARTLAENTWMINVGSQYSTSQRALDIAQKYNNVFAAIGLHPIHLEEREVDEAEVDAAFTFKTRLEEFDYEAYKELAKNKKVVAVGEIGLDYYYKPKGQAKLEEFKSKQKNALSLQLKLAKEMDLPVIFHCRVAHYDLIQFLKDNPGIRPEKAVVHCFVGSVADLKEYLNFGYYAGLNGIIFKNISGINFKEVIEYLPEDRMVLETDCPYLTPDLPESVTQKLQPAKEGFYRNEPLFVKYVAEKVGAIKDMSLEKVASLTTDNARKLFSI